MKFIRNNFVALFTLLFLVYFVGLIAVALGLSAFTEPLLALVLFFLGSAIAYFLSNVFFPALRTWRPWIIAGRIAPFAFMVWVLWWYLY